MGKGDKKTKKGKINIGSYGKSRPRKERNRITLNQNLKSGGEEE